MDTGIEYSDIFRQKTGRINTTVFSSRNHVQGSYHSGDNSLSVRVQSIKYYGEVVQHNSDFSVSSKYLNRSIETEWNSRLDFVRYTVTAGYSFDLRKNQPIYGAGIEIIQWEQYITASLSMKNSSIQNSTTVLFRDFLVPINQDVSATEIQGRLTLQPLPFVRSVLSFNRLNSANDARKTGYDAAETFTADTYATAIRFSFDSSFYAELFGERTLRATDAELKNDNQSFGSFFGSHATSNSTGIEISFLLFHNPFTVRYTYYELLLAGSGDVQSWPFTTLAASIISNRLYYSVTGSVKYHSVELCSDFSFDRLIMTTGFEYIFSVPDAALELWEPEFLVFGMKNFVRNSFSIRSAHLGKIYLSFTQSLLGINVNLTAEQYFPLKLTYRQFTPTNILPPGPTVPSQTPTTDGGRRIGIRFSFNL